MRAVLLMRSYRGKTTQLYTKKKGEQVIMPIVLTVAGKADSRAIVYPMLYVLKNYGRVMVASDDAAYRRLYHGYADAGEVSGVGVVVHPELDFELLSEEVNRYAPEFLVCVTNGYVPEFTTHLLVLTGYDRSFEGGNAFSKAEHEQGVKVKLAESDVVTAPSEMDPNNIREIIVSSSTIKCSDTLSVCLRDGLLLHAAKCEEYKAILPHESRDFVGVLAKILCPFILSVNEVEIPKLFGFKK